MINDYRIIVATFIANIELTGYKPVTTAAIRSWSNTDFVDDVLVLDGISIDNTKNIISNLSDKVKFIEHDKPWSLTDWTWEYLHSIENGILHNVNILENEKKILIALSSDTMFGDKCKEELRDICEKLTTQDQYDFLNYTFKKAITKNYVSNTYRLMPNWHFYSITKFRNNIKWKEIEFGECGIKASRNIKSMPYVFQHVPISYDMFCFTKQDIESKIKRHIDFINTKKPSVDDYIKNYWLSKMKRVGYTLMHKDDHPKEASEFIDNLDNTHFGYDLFEHVNEIL